METTTHDSSASSQQLSDEDDRNNNGTRNQIWTTNNSFDQTKDGGVRMNHSTSRESTTDQVLPAVTKKTSFSDRSEYKVVVRSTSRHSIKERPRRRVASRFNSFDYDSSENDAFLVNQQRINPKNIQRLAIIRWFISFLIGIYVAIIAIAVTLCNRYITMGKLAAVYALLKDCESVGCLVVPTLIWMLINMGLVFIGAYMVTFHAPLASGSGIPNVKCYLNGIHLPGLMSLRTLLAKAGGVVLSVSGGLACGKEGPMIHSGAICASGLARAEFRCGKRQWKPKVCDPMRTDDERRDFVAAGAASGVSAAFGSPIGGVLFSLEEGASFVKQMLTWRMLFSSMTACLVLNIIMSAISGHPGDMSHPGLVSFGHIGDISYRTFEIPIFIIMGIIGGLIGAAFVQLNYKITLFRRSKMTNPWMKVAEAVFVAACSAVIFMILIYAVPNCAPIRGYNDVTANKSHAVKNSSDENISVTTNNLTTPRTRRDNGIVYYEYADDDGEGHHSNEDGHAEDHGQGGHDEQHSLYGFHGSHGYLFKGFCPYGQHNRMADILFKTGEGGLHAVLHSPLDEWKLLPLLILFIVYHLLATWTYGLSVSSGVFIPSLLIGALWGRVIGIVVMYYIPAAGTNIAKYALVGAAANLGGATRMTLSLAVIVIECTGDVTFSLPIILALIAAKWTGDYFNPGIYDLHIEIQGIPLLPWEPPEMSFSIKASEVMTGEVDCLNRVEKLDRLKSIVESTTAHNGYPVVENDMVKQSYDDGAIRIRSEYDKNLSENSGRLTGFINLKNLKNALSELEKNGLEKRQLIDLEPFMDKAPYSISEETSLPRVFKIFRGLGLRHLVVVNNNNVVVGMITRVDLARYRGEMHKGMFVLEELAVE